MLALDVGGSMKYVGALICCWATVSVADEVLIVGDSISLDALPYLREELAAWTIRHARGNSGSTGRWHQHDPITGSTNLTSWIRTNPDVDIVSLNAGIWDRNTCNEPPLGNTTLADYEANLREAIDLIRSHTSALLSWQTTTPTSPEHPCVFQSSHQTYRDTALKVMTDMNVPVSDLYAISHLSDHWLSPSDLHFDDEGNALIGHQYATSIIQVAGIPMGDSNLDYVFETGDLILVGQSGEYEDLIPFNSTWTEGDWNRDRDFNSHDLVTAFQDGGYEQGPRTNAAAVPEPGGWLLLSLAAVSLLIVRSWC